MLDWSFVIIVQRAKAEQQISLTEAPVRPNPGNILWLWALSVLAKHHC